LAGAHSDERLDNIEHMLEDIVELPDFMTG
jgi:hypothetical protein